MAIYRLLQNVGFDPERIELVARAYEDTLRALHISDRNDPVTATIARTIFKLAQTDECSPVRLRQRTIAELGRAMPSRAASEVVGTSGAIDRQTRQ